MTNNTTITTRIRFFNTWNTLRMTEAQSLRETYYQEACEEAWNESVEREVEAAELAWFESEDYYF